MQFEQHHGSTAAAIEDPSALPSRTALALLEGSKQLCLSACVTLTGPVIFGLSRMPRRLSAAARAARRLPLPSPPPASESISRFGGMLCLWHGDSPQGATDDGQVTPRNPRLQHSSALQVVRTIVLGRTSNDAAVIEGRAETCAARSWSQLACLRGGSLRRARRARLWRLQ